jgi:hypothetical protein
MSGRNSSIKGRVADSQEGKKGATKSNLKSYEELYKNQTAIGRVGFDTKNLSRLSNLIKS